VILIDARKGVLTQTRRHSYLVSLIGIRKVVLAINKMDLVDLFGGGVPHHRGRVPRVRAADRPERHHRHPLSALKGDNMTEPAAHALVPRPDADGFSGDLRHRRGRDLQTAPFRLPVQWVNRPNLDFRGFCGTRGQRQVRPGDRIRVQPSGRESRVAAHRGLAWRPAGRPWPASRHSHAG
jgi:bifunctional enzyme CysN/CysC